MATTDYIYKMSAWQRKFQSLPHNEALGAGSAGPGKTRCLIAEPFQQIKVEHDRCANKAHPKHIQWGTSRGHALFLRRTFPMLAQTIDMTKTIFPRMDPGVKWDEESTTWTFSSGYKYQFGHCKDPDSWERYIGNEYCVAQGTRVLMADGSLRPIEGVLVGEMVQTLEGPKAVTHTWATGYKPCVEAVVRVQSEIVGTQLHPTTHPILAATIGGSQSEEFHRKPHNGGRDRPRGWFWQDYESLLCGYPESPVERASLAAAEIGCAAFGGSLQETLPLPTLSVPVVLHAPSVRRCLEAARLAMASREHQECSSRSERSRQEPLPRSPGSRADLERGEQAAPPASCCTEATCVCGGAGGPTDLGRATDSRARCSADLGLRGAQPLPAEGAGRRSAPPQDDAEERCRSRSRLDDEGHALQSSDQQGSSYAHFYTGQLRAVTEETRTGVAELRFAGMHETFDLTVADANQYITETGIINSQTIIMFDELVQFLENQYEMIRTRLRTSDPVLSKMLKVRAMSNPTLRRQKGGDDFVVNDPQWVRRYFVDKAQQGNVTLKKRLVRGDGTVFFRTRIYLPATLYDNPDPEFVRQYEETLLNEKPHIRAAMLYGDWYVQPGSYYADAWNKKIHVCKPFVIPDDWRVCRSMDWGYKVNGVIHWWAIDPDGNAFCVYEYVFKGKLADYVANEVQRIEKRFGWWHGKKSLLTGPADTQLWEARGDVSKSKAATFSDLGVSWQQADKRSRKNNALLLIGRLEDHQNGTTTPGIVFFDRCPYIISTLPSIQEDPTDSEEPLEGGEDHAHDSVVYFCAYASHGLKGSKAIGTRKDDDFPDDEDGESSDDRGRLGYGAQA